MLLHSESKAAVGLEGADRATLWPTGTRREVGDCLRDNVAPDSMQLEQRSPAQGLALAGHDTGTATLSSPLLTRCGPDSSVLGHVAPGCAPLPQAPPLPLAAAPFAPRTTTSLPGAGTAVPNPPSGAIRCAVQH